MKKLGLWMMAAILLCGSVVTFVACRGNSLEDIIGNVDNGSGNSDEVKTLLELIQNAETIIVTVKYMDNNTDLEFKKENGSFVYQGPDGPAQSTWESTFYTLRIENEKELIFNAYLVYSSNAPYFGVIVDAEKKEFSRVNYNASYDLVSIKIDGQSVELTDACPNKAVVKATDNNDMFYVYYASGETWEDVVNRYAKAFGGSNVVIVVGTGNNTVSLWRLNSGAYEKFNLKYNIDGDVVPVKYSYIVGKREDGTTAFDGAGDSYKIYQ